MKKAMLFGLVLVGAMLVSGMAFGQDVWVTRSTYVDVNPFGSSYSHTQVTTTTVYPVAPVVETETRTYYVAPGYRRTYISYYPSAPVFVDYRSDVMIRAYDFVVW